MQDGRVDGRSVQLPEQPMPHISNTTLEIGLYSAAGVVLLYLGYRFGRWIGSVAASKVVNQKEQDLFTAQKGFKALYEQELAGSRDESQRLAEQVRLLTVRVEEYRKKAA